MPTTQKPSLVDQYRAIGPAAVAAALILRKGQPKTARR